MKYGKLNYAAQQSLKNGSDQKVGSKYPYFQRYLDMDAKVQWL